MNDSYKKFHWDLDGTKYRTAYVDDIKMAGREQNSSPMWKNWMKLHHFLTTCIWDALNVHANRTKTLLASTENSLNHEFLLEQLKNCHGGETSHKNYRVVSYDRDDMRKSALKCIVNRADKKTAQLYNVSTPCLDDHNFKMDELERELPKVCSQIVFLKSLH